MMDELVSAEKVRFSGLSQREAQSILEKMEGQTPALRSCWYCNGAHEHLKQADYPIRCFGCWGWYLSGYPAPIVDLRAKDEPITDEVMQKMTEYTRERN